MGRYLCRLLVLAAGLAAPLAAAYPEPVDFDGSLSRWDIERDNAAITYAITADNAEDVQNYRPAIDAAADLWNHVPGSYARYAPVGKDAEAQVTIQLQSSLSGVRNTAGYTIFDKYKGDKPVHCQIVVQVGDNLSYVGIAKTFLHEMGHGLGLGHSLVPQAIMSYSLSKNHFELDVDDDAAVAHLYPEQGGKPKKPLGCAVASGVHGRCGGAALLALLLAPLLLVRPRRTLRLKP